MQHRTQYPGYYYTPLYKTDEELKKSVRFQRKNQHLLQQTKDNLTQILNMFLKPDKAVQSSVEEGLINLQKSKHMQNHEN